MEIEEQIRRIQKGDERAYEDLFFQYYSRLCGFAVKIVGSDELAKDCVQEVFLKIWRNRANWEVNYSLSVYLYRAVRNQALNKIEKRRTKRDYTQQYYEEGFHKKEEQSQLSSEKSKLIEKIWKVVTEMPDRRRMVFELHKRHGLSYKEIAEVMGITRKTVENHMGRALQDIRDKISHNKF